MTAFRDLVQKASRQAGGLPAVKKDALNEPNPEQNPTYPEILTTAQREDKARRDAVARALVSRALSRPRLPDTQVPDSPSHRQFLRDTARQSAQARTRVASPDASSLGPASAEGHHTLNTYETSHPDAPRRVSKGTVEKMSDQVRHLAERSGVITDDGLPSGWVAAFPTGTHPSRGTGGFYVGRQDWLERERGGRS